MFDIGFLELVIIAVIALVVLGPERLPSAVRATALWIARIKRSCQGIRSEIERELKVDEIRRDIHNHTVMDELKHTRDKVHQDANPVDHQADRGGSGPHSGAKHDSGFKTGSSTVDRLSKKR